MSTPKAKKAQNPQEPPELKAKPAPKQKDALVKGATDRVNGQANSPAGGPLVNEATTIKSSLVTLSTKEADHELAKQVVTITQKGVVTARGDVRKAIGAYDFKALGITTDPAVLVTLGTVPDIRKKPAPIAGPGVAPDKIGISAGLEPGWADVTWNRPPGVAAFMVQYMVEGEPPGVYQPPEGFFTKKASWTIKGLPPAASIRVRVKSIGEELGDWSDEALGRAR